jgi:hypothetical protein
MRAQPRNKMFWMSSRDNKRHECLYTMCHKCTCTTLNIIIIIPKTTTEMIQRSYNTKWSLYRTYFRYAVSVPVTKESIIVFEEIKYDPLIPLLCVCVKLLHKYVVNSITPKKFCSSLQRLFSNWICERAQFRIQDTRQTMGFKIK